MTQPTCDLTPDALADELLADDAAHPSSGAKRAHAIVLKYKGLLKARGPEYVLAMATTLRNVHGAWYYPIALLAGHKETFQSLLVSHIEAFGQGMDSWGKVDSFSRALAGPAWLHGRLSDEDIDRWAHSYDLWWRRAALVATVALNTRSKGGLGDTPRTLAVCRLLVDDHENIVEKALSWALRMPIWHDPDAVRSFLAKHDAVLAARVKREVRNKLETGLKNPRRQSA